MMARTPRPVPELALVHVGIVDLDVAGNGEPLAGAAVLQGFKSVVEFFAVDALGRGAVHHDEAAVGVQGEAAVSGLFGQAGHRAVVQAEIEDGLHHAGHGAARLSAPTPAGVEASRISAHLRPAGACIDLFLQPSDNGGVL
jgi:hypothetical protein